jgi:hypothetical protein
MKNSTNEFDLLLAAVSQSDGEAARELLAAKGIACKHERKAVQTAELGASIMHVPRPDLFVPKGSKSAARAILVQAWGEARVARFDSGST